MVAPAGISTARRWDASFACACGIGRAVFAIGAATEDRDTLHGFAEMRQGGQHKLLVSSTFARGCAEGHCCFTAK